MKMSQSYGNGGGGGGGGSTPFNIAFICINITAAIPKKEDERE